MGNYTICDSHYHATSRSANDYESLALAGVKYIIEPSHRARQYFDSKNQYFDIVNRRITDETLRAGVFGINFYSGVGLMACDFRDDNVFYDTLESISNAIRHENVCAYGEIEYDPKVNNAKEIFLKQLEIFNNGKLPIIINIPHKNRQNVMEETLSILSEMKNSNHSFGNVILDGILIHEVAQLQHYGFGAFGIPISPRLDALFVVFRKSYPDEILNELKKNTIDLNKIIFNSSMGYGFGDPWGMAKVADYLVRSNISLKIVQQLFYENAMSFFKLKDTIRK